MTNYLYQDKDTGAYFTLEGSMHAPPALDLEMEGRQLRRVFEAPRVSTPKYDNGGQRYNQDRRPTEGNRMAKSLYIYIYTIWPRIIIIIIIYYTTRTIESPPSSFVFAITVAKNDYFATMTFIIF